MDSIGWMCTVHECVQCMAVYARAVNVIAGDGRAADGIEVRVRMSWYLIRVSTEKSS
jgi:hypothetical protein